MICMNNLAKNVPRNLTELMINFKNKSIFSDRNVVRIINDKNSISETTFETSVFELLGHKDIEKVNFKSGNEL